MREKVDACEDAGGVVHPCRKTGAAAREEEKEKGERRLESRGFLFRRCSTDRREKRCEQLVAEKTGRRSFRDVSKNEGELHVRVGTVEEG